ncbi:MAG: acyl-CoA thioesterase [Pirellulaceae bacterium]
MKADVPELLKDYPIVLTLPILWGDQDAFGHVNNVVYFRWCESARVAYLNDTGLQDLLTKDNLDPILASVKCDYLKQLNFPDTVQIGARITRIGNKSVAMEHAIYSESLQAIAAKADSVVVVFDYAKQKSCAIPMEVRDLIEKIENSRSTPPA